MIEYERHDLTGVPDYRAADWRQSGATTAC